MAELPIFGINVPYLEESYGHDLAPNERHPDWGCDFSTMKAYRPLVHAASLGFRAVRVWLCENGEGIVTEAGRPARPHPQLTESVAVMQEAARLLGVRIYWTLLDGNSWKREGDALSHAILGDTEATARFAEDVAAPLVRGLDPEVTLAVELVNEPEAMTPSCVRDGERLAWPVLGRSLRRIGDAIRAARPGLRVTAGTGHVYLPELFRAEPALDAVDVHVYHLTGGLPSREELATAVGDRRVFDGSMAVIAGECGIPDEAPDAALPGLVNYLFNARALGYEAAFLWQSEGLFGQDNARDRLSGIAVRMKNVLAQLRAEA